MWQFKPTQTVGLKQAAHKTGGLVLMNAKPRNDSELSIAPVAQTTDMCQSAAPNGEFPASGHADRDPHGRFVNGNLAAYQHGSRSRAVLQGLTHGAEASRELIAHRREIEADLGDGMSRGQARPRRPLCRMLRHGELPRPRRRASRRPDGSRALPSGAERLPPSPRPPTSARGVHRRRATREACVAACGTHQRW